MDVKNENEDITNVEKNIRGEENTASGGLNAFVQKNRKFLFIGLIAIAVLLLGTIVVTTVQEKATISSFTKVDELNQRYEELMPHIADAETLKDMSSETKGKQADIDKLLEDLSAFQAKSSGYAAATAYGISASIHETKKNWEEAEKAWASAGKAAGKSYFAPLSFFHAAVAAEERGNTEAALDFYKQALSFETAYTVAARSQFSVGRLEESRNNNDAALEAYRALLNKWPDDPLWANLAQNRILVLSR